MKLFKLLVLSALISLAVAYWAAFKSPVFALQMTQYISRDWSIELWSINHSQYTRCYEVLREEGFDHYERLRTCNDRAYGHPYFASFDKLEEIIDYDFARFGMTRLDHERKRGAPEPVH